MTWRTLRYWVVFSLGLLWFAGLALPAPLAQDDEPVLLMPVSTWNGTTTQLGLHFSALKQGRVGLLSLFGDNIASAQAAIFNRTYDFFQMPDAIWYGFINVSLDQAIRSYELVVTVKYADASRETILARVDVANGAFVQQNVTLPPDKFDLLDKTAEAAELEQLAALSAPITPLLWDDRGFIAPIGGELTSPFGAVRVFNDTYPSLHTGWDFRAKTGEPFYSAAAGEVVFAGTLPIRGNYVLVNHGAGIYSGYAHLSVVFVTQGQKIHAGQIIGRIGSSGRSSSAHAHFEMLLAGSWIDPVDFIQMPIPR